MATKLETTAAVDAAKSEGRRTDPGICDEATYFEEQISSEKPFDPRRYQAYVMPPGLRTEMIRTKLPSMPRDRIEETMPPTKIAELMGDTAFPGAEDPTAPEVSRPISSVPGTALEPDAGGSEPPLTPVVVIHGISYWIAVPLAILMFAAGVLVVLLSVRDRGGTANGIVSPAPSAVSPPEPVAPESASVPRAIPEPTAMNAPKADATSAVETGRPKTFRKHRTSFAGRTQKAGRVRREDAQKPRMHYDEPE